MAGMKAPKRDALLLDGMADKLDADLVYARADRTLTQAAATEMAERCKQCTKRDDCIMWLVNHDGGAAKAPPFCLNAETLDFLAMNG